MSSPIHKYLFSPPPSPPTQNRDWAARKPSLTPIKLVSELLPHARSFDAERGEMKPRSPRTPQQRQFTLDNAYPSPYPGSPKIVIDAARDSPSTPKASALAPGTPKRRSKADKEKISSPPYLATNVPSTPMPIPSALPRPLVRLMVFVSLILGCILLLVFVPSARLPNLHDASISRRLKMAPDGRAYLDVVRGADSWEAARDRDYQPPQIRVKQLNRRSREARREKRAVAPPSASRREPRPIPASHEFLALQSYLLQSSYHTLPHTIDPSAPLDAHMIFGLGSHHFGEPGSHKEHTIFAELEKEREADVVVWYGGNGKNTVPHYLLDAMAKIHDKNRHPILMPCHGRSDLALLSAVLARLGLPTDQPIVMIGNKPVVATREDVQKMEKDGSLRELLKSIGWVKPDSKGRKPKMAVLKKKAKVPHEELEQRMLE